MKRQWLLYALLAVATFVMSSAHAQTERGGRQEQGGRPSAGGSPLLAVVSLGDQRVTVYDADGKIMQSPVSSGATGYETPAGVFSVVQKNEEHYSNLYEDGNMPFMQRITWTGIALHAGTLPGHPASHGCVRLPSQFATRLFGQTELGMRVVLAPEDMVPAEIAHPLLFQPHRQTATQGSLPKPGSPRYLDMMKSVAASRSADAEAAVRRAKQLRLAAAKRIADAASAAQALRTAEAGQAKAEGVQKDADLAIESATSPEARAKAEETKAKASAKVVEAAAQLDAARGQAQARKEAAASAEEEAKAAEAERQSAQDAADLARRRTSPVSVFISRKMQRLYVRQANEPIFEGPVAIADPDKAIGTFVFTALKYADTTGEVRWNVVSMYKNPTSNPSSPEPAGTKQRGKGGARNAAPVMSDVAGAKTALDRISMPKEVTDLIGDVLPGSSLVISDEATSIETGKDTDFIVVMSGEPQGALKIREHPPMVQNDDLFDQPQRGGSYRRSPYGSSGFSFPFNWK